MYNCNFFISGELFAIIIIAQGSGYSCCMSLKILYSGHQLYYSVLYISLLRYICFFNLFCTIYAELANNVFWPPARSPTGSLR